MRRILLSTLKILVSAALLYFSLRKVDLAELVARIDVSSLGWIGVAIAVTFLQIFVGVLRWREISAECGAPLPTRQAMRFNVIGTFFNQTLPSSIGGDAVRLWLVARSGAGWRAATYSIFVDRAIGLIALAVIIVASLPWSYRLITDPHGRSALLFVDFAALAGGLGFLLLGRLPWPWLKRWWGTHHIHACSVIANRVLFSRVHGPKVAVLSLLVHVLAVVIAWCVVQSIAAPVLFGQIFQLVPPVMLITMLPISIAGWGVREATMGLAFGYAGLMASEGVNISLLYGAVSFMVGAVGGLVWILSAEKAAQGIGAHRSSQITSEQLSTRIEWPVRNYLLSFAAAVPAALLSGVLTWAIRPLLVRIALARPNARSSHRVPTPQGAGIAVIAATLIAAVTVIAFAGAAEIENSRRGIRRDAVHRGRWFCR